jgi:uncharacterized protein
MGERTRYDPGTFCWVGLATSDVAAAKAFYGSPFSWLGGRGLAGGSRGRIHGVALRRPGRRDPLPAAAGVASGGRAPALDLLHLGRGRRRHRGAGGAALRRSGLPRALRCARRRPRCRHPRSDGGGVVALAARSRIGAQFVNDTGALCWNELARTEVERAKSLYGELLDWEYQTDYVSVTNAGRLNGGMRGQTEQDRRAAPAWLPYTVESANQIPLQAARPGGRGLRATSEGPRGRYAVIADPQNAAFAVFEGETDP